MAAMKAVMEWDSTCNLQRNPKGFRSGVKFFWLGGHKLLFAVEAALLYCNNLTGQGKRFQSTSARVLLMGV
jgi:hypothetical protein